MTSAASRKDRSSRIRNRAATGVLAALLTAGSFAGTANAQNRDLPPVINANLPNRVADEYIVVFKSGISSESVQSAQANAARMGAKIGYRYHSIFAGFNATIPASLLQKFRQLPGIAYLEANQVGTLNTVQNSPPAGLD